MLLCVIYSIGKLEIVLDSKLIIELRNMSFRQRYTKLTKRKAHGRTYYTETGSITNNNYTPLTPPS